MILILYVQLLVQLILITCAGRPLRPVLYVDLYVQLGLMPAIKAVGIDWESRLIDLVS